LRAGAPGSFEPLSGKTVLIAGAGGLIAGYLAMSLLEARRMYGLGLRVVMTVRDEERARVKYARWLVDDGATLIKGDNAVDPPGAGYDGPADYIVHAGGASSPTMYIDDPVGVFLANVNGAVRLLDAARARGAKKFIFLSTREIYGESASGYIEEGYCGAFDHLKVRNVYPESKRAVESAMAAWSAQYGAPRCASVRLASVYGPGMKLGGDGRAISSIIAAAAHGDDIKLASDGSSIRSYCYAADAVDGLLRIMLADPPDGPAVDVYNLANETEPRSVIEYAKAVAAIAGVNAFAGESDTGGAAYSSFPYTPLDTSRVEALGWKPAIGFAEGARRTLEYFDSTR
jgi:nucleoside-diphosphate-sugar epimerase